MAAIVPFDVNTYMRYTAATAGRDKAIRTIQYGARFLAGIGGLWGASPDTLKRLELLKKNTSLTRKLMRVGKWIDSLNTAQKALETRDYFLRLTLTGKSLCQAGFLFVDTLIWLNSTGVYKFKNGKNFSKIYARFWLSALLLSIISGLYKLRAIAARAALLRRITANANVNSEKGVDPEIAKEISTIKKDKATAVRALVQDSLDAIIPVAMLELAPISEGIVGLAGLLTSLMGAEAQWAKALRG
ncbi:peroxisomal biogenesis factor 11 [Ramicandelaber brevisporus]|nr:peroxisomal biogenesis factor 11 [Ramicandelaber brevisporus]